MVIRVRLIAEYNLDVDPDVLEPMADTIERERQAWLNGGVILDGIDDNSVRVELVQ